MSKKVKNGVVTTNNNKDRFCEICKPSVNSNNRLHWQGALQRKAC